MSELVFSPARNPDLRQFVYEQIKEAIVEGKIQPGERLSESDLAEKFDVSRTPVREAIRQLSQTGLVRLVPRRGGYVSLPTAKDAADLYEIRIALEMLALDHVCLEPPLEELRRLREQFGQVSNNMDPNEFLAQDRQFHGLLSRTSGNALLQTVLHNVSDLIQLCRHYSIEGVLLVESANEHIQIIDAILAGDTAASKARMTHHLSRAREALIGYILRHPEYVSAFSVPIVGIAG
jgi:DNA-binding GntR family transcriptional regulator